MNLNVYMVYHKVHSHAYLQPGYMERRCIC